MDEKRGENDDFDSLNDDAFWSVMMSAASDDDDDWSDGDVFVPVI
jgi:hypothetical protein